jgi:hypothetical protein
VGRDRRPPGQGAGAGTSGQGSRGRVRCPQTVAAGFGPELAAVTAGRVGLGLFSTGPLVGTSWLLVAAATWTRHRPVAALGLVAALVGWPWR